MELSGRAVVFFDIGETLGAVQLTPPPPRLQSLHPFPCVVPTLEGLRSREVRIGIISNTGQETAAYLQRVLDAAGLFRFLEADLLIYSSVVGLGEDSPEIFALAAKRAGLATLPDRCIYVGEDSLKRAFARQAGMRACPHPSLVNAVLEGEQLYYVSLDVPDKQHERPWRSRLKELTVVPLSGGSFAGRTAYALAAGGALAWLANSQFEVQVLGRADLPLETDLYLLRDDEARSTGFLAADGQSQRLLERDDAAEWLLAASQSGLLVALPAGRSVEEVHFKHARHGHRLKLTVDPSLLEPLEGGAAGRSPAWLESASLVAEPVTLNAQEQEVLKALDATAVRRHLDRYSGIKPLGDGGGEEVRSRHIHAEDNARVTAQLACDLEKIGGGHFAVRCWPFTHEGRSLLNVEAELPGENGESPELVLVTAHLDSTAAFSPPYDPVHDPAPGADDDGSGVAAVLAIAECMKALADARPPRWSIRFVLFNAEEHGLVGSQSYARAQAATGAAIVAVYQLDMIGYNLEQPRSFEVHAGFWPSSDVQQRSAVLARRLSELTPLVSPKLELPQIYRSMGPEPTERDPADGRSDHAAFQQHGYAACVVSEDFFAGPAPESPQPESNPNYHKETDTFVDFEYAADIARAVAAAAWATARI
jgi:FMN phosphatase YigB (HAD superfamily)